MPNNGGMKHQSVILELSCPVLVMTGHNYKSPDY